MMLTVKFILSFWLTTKIGLHALMFSHILSSASQALFPLCIKHSV